MTTAGSQVSLHNTSAQMHHYDEVRIRLTTSQAHPKFKLKSQAHTKSVRLLQVPIQASIIAPLASRTSLLAEHDACVWRPYSKQHSIWRPESSDLALHYGSGAMKP